MTRKQRTAIRVACRKNAPAYRPGAKITAEKLCGPPLWGSFTKSEHLEAGKYIRELVRQGQLRLQYAGTTTANLAVYIRI